MLQMQIRYGFTTVCLLSLQIISSFSKCKFTIYWDHCLDHFQHSLIPCRVFPDNIHMFCALCRKYPENVVSNLHIMRFCTNFYPYFPGLYAFMHAIPSFYIYCVSNRHCNVCSSFISAITLHLCHLHIFKRYWLFSTMKGGEWKHAWMQNHLSPNAPNLSLCQTRCYMVIVSM